MKTGSRARFLWRGAIRPLIRNPRPSVLGILSVALGVAVFLSITIANRSAMESFRQAFVLVTGRADLEIRGSIPEAAFPSVQRCDGVAAASPLIEMMVTLPDFPGESLRLEGIDPFTAQGLIGFDPTRSGESGELSAWLGETNAVAATPEFLAGHGLKQGEGIRLQGPGASRRMKITHLIGGSEAVASGGRVVATDIATAQEWAGCNGVISAILVKLRNPAERDEVAARLRILLPKDVTVEPPAHRSRQVEVMLSAFQLNLTALSLVSLLVGVFFIGNTAAAAVVRARVSLGILRAVGASRRDLFVLVLAEAFLGGLIGSILGILSAPPLASLMAAPVAQTITALYLPVEAHGGWPTSYEAIAAILAGVGASLVAAWIPAQQAARVDPKRVLHPGSAPELFPVPAARFAACGAGLLILAATFSVATLHGAPPALGFPAAFFVLAGFSLMVPVVTRWTSTVMGKGFAQCRGSGVAIQRIAVEQMLRNLHRTAPTIAALAAAVAMTVGISVMIHSFRGSVMDWAARTLTADLFIAPASNELLGLAHTLPEGTASWWSSRRDVVAVGTFREEQVRLANERTNGEPVTLGVIDGPARGEIDFMGGDGVRKSAELARGGGVALSESLGRRLSLGPGDTITLQAPDGPLTLPVIDLYRDYTRDRGIALVHASVFRRHWNQRGVHSLAIVFRKGTENGMIEREKEAFLAAFGGKEAFACYSNAGLRARILEIFNQTFAVTAVLRSISIAVAFGGVMLTLGILVMERSRDLGVLRAMGAGDGQVIRLVLTEAALIGAIASVVGLFSGAALSLVLTWVINKAFFGWSIQLAFPWAELMFLPLWMTSTALVAGALPARTALSITPAASIRME